MLRLLTVLAISVFASACADAYDDLEDSEAIAELTAESTTAATANELRVRAGELTVWIDRPVALRVEGGQVLATIHGRASRNLVAVSSFIPDEPFGVASITGPRSFEIRLTKGYELNTLLNGGSVLVALEVATGTFHAYTARIDLGAGFTGFTGSGAAFVDATIRPVYAGPDADPLRYRAKVRTTKSLTVAAGAPAVSPAPGGFVVDWTAPAFPTVLVPTTKVTFRLGDGTTKSARTRVTTTALGLTTEDPYEVWSTTCEPAVGACLSAAMDRASCGTFRAVHACIH